MHQVMRSQAPGQYTALRWLAGGVASKFPPTHTPPAHPFQINLPILLNPKPKPPVCPAWCVRPAIALVLSTGGGTPGGGMQRAATQQDLGKLGVPQ